jgi:hypothetical protein
MMGSKGELCLTLVTGEVQKVRYREHQASVETVDFAQFVEHELQIARHAERQASVGSI